MGKKKATDEQVIEAYGRLGSVWKAADELGMCGQSVHERLQKLGVDTHANIFTDEEIEYLADVYTFYRDAGKLQVLADEMGRTKYELCRQAGKLGLTNPKVKRPWLRKWAGITKPVATDIWEDFKRSDLGVTEFCEVRHYGAQLFTDAMNRYFPDEYDMVVESKCRSESVRKAGMDLEFDVRKDMLKHGYYAMRYPNSKSPADVYALRYGELVFIQCKLNGSFPPGEWNQFLDFCNSVGAKPLMACRNAECDDIEYWLLTGKKTPGDNHTAQPKERWEPRLADIQFESHME